MIGFRINANLGKILNKTKTNAEHFSQYFQDYALDIAQIILDENKKAAPHKSGELEKSLDVDIKKSGDSYKIIVFSKLPYEPAVRLGANAHDIYPLTAGILKFSVNGAVIFSPHVYHTGIKENRYDLTAKQNALPKITNRRNELKAKLSHDN